MSARDRTLRTSRGDAAYNLYVLDLEKSGDAKQLTHFADDVGIELTYPVISERLAWSPDSRAVCFSAKAPFEPDRVHDAYGQARQYTKLRYKSGENGWWDGRRRRLWLVDVSSGDLQPLTTGDGDAWGAVFNGKGDTVAFTSGVAFGNEHRNTLPDTNPYAGQDVWLLDLHSKTTTKLTESDGPNMTPSFSPDGTKVAYFGHRNGVTGWAYSSHLWVRDLSGGEPRDLLETWDYSTGSHVLSDLHDVFAPPAAAWDEGGETLYFQGTVRGAANLFGVTIGTREVFPVTEGDHEVQLASFSRDGSRFAALIGDGLAPADVFVGDTSGASLTRLTHLNESVLEELDVRPVRKQTFSLAGRDVDVFMIGGHADDTEPVPRPTIIHLFPSFTHGWAFNFEHQLLASAGFMVVCPNTLGAASYGEDSLAGSYVRGPWFTDADEVVDLVGQLVDAGVAQQDRVGVTGDAYGGALTNWLITQTDVFAASCERRGAARFWPPLSDRFTGIASGESDIYSEPSAAIERSPIRHVHSVRTPHMTIQTLGDTRGSFNGGEEIFVALKALGRAAKLVLFQHDHHFQARTAPPRVRAAFFACVAEWFLSQLVDNGGEVLARERDGGENADPLPV